ncbi:uncharacterized protein A1O9_10879 [Exophiala aquamarina CBS 119918]|uniref:FAD-binding FR-type domain-containing protein n=1 Tax=Exophiala aquamarina CBS 119918 TaxID=1182545 RepID=A0A072NZX2_9EURO|nr:uncharacterized protein A1O9_10879 [Exophiala aquamarina CBS 119918]KEF52972.1 hypothetical protein A1O9_10879 [Exophiala aquamarina CBS 119918]
MWRGYANSNESIASLVKSTINTSHPQQLRYVLPKSEYQEARGRFSLVPVYITTHWRLYAWNYAFSAAVLSLQLGFGAWQCYKYSTNEAVREAFGWGVPVAKFGAGALYPTIFFLVLSMSRWLATICRYVGGQRYLNWDRNRYFHIRMAVMALVLSLLHTCGHIMGTIPSAVQPEHRQAVTELIGTKIKHVDWTGILLSRPGWTGAGALLIFMIIGTCSVPPVRKKWFETFQVAHLLMFPMLVLLTLHGTAALFQFPALGFVMAGPLAIILCEKLVRASQLLRSRVARIKPVSNDCVEVTIFTSRGKRRPFYRPGQYILVRVPRLSRFQWHPFTVVRAVDGELVVIVKKNGWWTHCLQEQPEFMTVNLDGPFGAPCQGFWDYDNSILIGMGAGLTPSAAVLNELLAYPTQPWMTCRRNSQNTRSIDEIRKRVCVIWVVRDTALLDTFTPLLEAITLLPQQYRLDLSCRIYISDSGAPFSADGRQTTGRPLNRKGSQVEIHLGKRPNFVSILRDHHHQLSKVLREIVLQTGQPRRNRPRIGVFFCGSQSAKSDLRQICFQRTLQGVIDGSDLEYHFHPEVF